MAPRHWADQTQIAWLNGWMPEFIKRQAEGKLHLFWAPMEEAWFKAWPEHVNLSLPLPNDATARPLTGDELATLGAAIQCKKKVRNTYFMASTRQ